MKTGRSIAALTFVLALGAGPIALANSSQDKNVLPASVGDLEQAQLIEVRDTTGTILLHGTLKTSKKELDETERKAELVSPTGQKTKGKAEIEIERKNGVISKEEVEVKLENLPTMTQFELALDGKHVTSFMTTKAGKAELKLERKAPSRH
jgi:hypothetical protein